MLHSGIYLDRGVLSVTLEGRDLPVLLAIALAGIVVEVLLSRREDGRLGLLLPAAWTLWTAVWLLRNLEHVRRLGDELTLVLGLCSVPLLLLLAVYGLCRLARRRRMRRQLQRTQIDDL